MKKSLNLPQDWAALPLLLSPNQTAQVLGIGRTLLYQLLDHNIPTITVGRRKRIVKEALLTWIHNKNVGGNNTHG